MYSLPICLLSFNISWLVTLTQCYKHNEIEYFKSYAEICVIICYLYRYSYCSKMSNSNLVDMPSTLSF